MDFSKQYLQGADQLEDFWHRRDSRAQFERQFHVFGRAVVVASNDEGVLTAVDHSRSLFTHAAPTAHPPFSIQIVVQPSSQPVEAAPDGLMQHIVYTGDGDWLMLQLGQWGHAHVDLEKGTAVAVLTPELAQRPELVSRCLLNTILLNFMIASGMGMLHASCLQYENHLLLLLAPHNSGKSTTALRLALAGGRLLSDSMVFVRKDEDVMSLMGFPIGKIKLRGDMVAHFPRLEPFLSTEVVREEVKHSVDLRLVGKELVQETARSLVRLESVGEAGAVNPTHIRLCLLTRHDKPETIIKPAEETAVWDAIMQNSLYFDTATVWQRNLTQLAPIVQRAAAYHLTIGTNSASILEKLGMTN